MLEEIWQGCGGRGSAASVKVQVRLDLTTGRLEGPYLGHGRQADVRCPLPQTETVAGSLRIADLGYWDLDVLSRIDKGDGYWLSRLKLSTVIFDAQGQRCDLFTLLTDDGRDVIDLPIFLGAEHRLPCRLLAVRVPEGVAAPPKPQTQS